MNKSEIVIVAAKRTPIGAFMGSLASLSATDLGAHAHLGAIAAAGIKSADIDAVISGCVLQAGLGQAPARQAAIKAGIPYASSALTINRVCGSSLQAVILAHDSIYSGSSQICLASGMESMTNAPYLLAKARSGYRFGHGQIIDHMQKDGLEDAYQQGQAMGCFAEKTAQAHHLSREAQDEFAASSMQKALSAQISSAFTDEISPITLLEKNIERIIASDENPNQDKLAKISRLKPAFDPNGTVTAANSSSLADGAASLILMNLDTAKKHAIKPLAKIKAHASHSQEPEWFTTAPVGAIQSLLKKTSWSINDVDLWEINEAFAVVPMVAIKELKLDPKKVNVHGGACALGHPIGASGARVLVTLIHALLKHGKKRGIASLCIGGGEATALAIEIIHD